MSKPKAIRSILETTLKGLELDTQLRAYSLWGAWRDIVGESVASQTQLHAIRNRILFIDVSHPAWTQQLQFLKPTLLQKINAFLGENLIQDIRFHIGKIPTHAPQNRPDAHPPRRELLDEETLQRIETVLQKIEDGEVKKALRTLLIKGAKLERSREKVK